MPELIPKIVGVKIEKWSVTVDLTDLHQNIWKSLKNKQISIEKSKNVLEPYLIPQLIPD